MCTYTHAQLRRQQTLTSFSLRERQKSNRRQRTDGKRERWKDIKEINNKTERERSES